MPGNPSRTKTTAATTFFKVAATALLFAACGVPALAEDISLEDLQGVTVHTSTSYVGRFRNDRGEAPGGFTSEGTIKIGPGAKIESKFVRNTYADTPRGRVTGSLTRSGSSEIGKSREMPDGSGAAVWLLDGDTLVALRVYERGGVSVRIKFEKSGTTLNCSISAPMANEVGAGPTTDKSAMQGGGKVRVLHAKQTASSCRVSRNE